MTIGVVGGPQLAIQLLAPEIRQVPGAFTVVALALTPVCLVAAFLLYLHWRVAGSGSTGMATMVLALFGAHGFTMAGLWLTQDRPAVSPWEVLLNLGTALALVAVALRRDRILAIVDPLSFGIAAGLCVSVVDVVVIRFLPPAGSSDGLWAAAHAAALVAFVAVAAAMVVCDQYERWATLRLGGAIALLAVPRLAVTLAPESAVLTTASLTCGVVGAVLLCDTAIALLSSAVHEKSQVLAGLEQRMRDLDAERRTEEERLHEVRGTIAAIASACRVIRSSPDLAPRRRARLEEMLEVESRRLVRLVHDRPLESAPRRVDLDRVIRPLVTAQEVQGRSVRWSPTGQLVDGDHDRLSDALTILLDNAAKHGTGADAEIAVRREHSSVRIEVTDRGPGVSRELRDRVFARGVKGPASRGQGLGLHLAQRLVTESGSTLRLGDSDDGARFVIDLQTTGPGEDA